MANETLTVMDNRTNATYTIPLFKGNVRALDLRHIKDRAPAANLYRP